MHYKTLINKTFCLMLLMALFMPWQTKAQETLTLYENETGTSNKSPIYWFYFDAFSRAQTVFPASDLADMDGGTITAIKFYTSFTSAYTSDKNVDVYLAEVASPSISSFVALANTTNVYHGTISLVLVDGKAQVTIELATPYEYHGGNLLFGCDNEEIGTYKNVSFYGKTTSGASVYGSASTYGGATADQSNFLPKTTFTYTTAAGGCAKPSTITIADITSNSATVNWTGESENYNVQYKKSSDTDWTIRVSNFNGTSVELTGLEANTAYQVQVQSICEGNVTSGWKSASFETPCASEESFPFNENFNSLTTNGEIPPCWDNDEGTTTNANYKWSYYSTGHEGKCVRFNSYSNSYNTNFLKTVPMDLPAGKTMQLRFWYKNPTGGDFSVSISTDGGVTHNTALSEHLANQTDWTEEEIVLGNYTGQNNVVIVFKGTSNNGFGDAYIYLDDVYVEEAPTCPKQSGLHYTAVTSSSVTLDWTKGTDDQDRWDVFITEDVTVTPDANTNPTIVNTDQKPYMHNGLNDGKTYYAFVRARCSATDQSPWTTACRFTTPQTPVTIDGEHPYSTDFESGCDWMFINGDYANQWCYGSAANNTENGSKAIYISNDNGVTNAYSAVKSVEYATKNFTFAEGVYTFSFDWRAKGNQYYDFIRVALVPASVELISTENSPFNDSSLPTGWIAIDGGSKLNNKDSWQTVVAEEISVPAGDYRVVVGWRNFTNTLSQPPAAIDNVSIRLVTSPRPTNLTTSNITGRTATLSWTENGTATNWVLEYATASDFTGARSVPVSGTASKELTGLSPETKYYARVKSILGDDGSSWSDVKDFTTLATCPKPKLSFVSYSNTAFSGSVSWTGSTADAFEIAYRPTSDFNPSDYTLENVIRITRENLTEYTYTLENLTPETKYYIYIQANCGDEDGKSQWSNRVIFTTLATCLAPSYLTDESVTYSSVNLSWTKGAEDQDAWQFRYKKTTDSEYSYVLVENHPSNSYELTGLEPATSYDVNVRAWCGGDDYSKWSLANQSMDKSITTACASITLPYSCDFEGAVETGGHFSTYSVPKCWDRIEMQYGSYSPYTYYPHVYSQSSDAHGGTKSLRMYRTPNSANQTIILPEIDEQYAMTNLQIRFWAKAGSSNNTLSVGIMENGTFSEVQAVEGVSTSYAEFTVLLTHYTGNGRNIAIKCGTSSSYLYYYIDDVKVEEIPSCFIPTDLANTAVTYNSASFVWQAGKDEAEWNIQYKKASDSEWDDNNIVHVTELPTAEQPFVVTGLQRGTDYLARIQACCDADDQSEWSTMPVSFTTNCGIWPIDAENSLFEDFSNSAFPPTCWNWIRVNNYHGWQHSSGQYNPLDQQGTAYSYWPSGETYLILPQMHINGAAKLTFDMVFQGDGSGEESSVVLSTTGWDKLDFTTTLWTATEFPTSKTTISRDLTAYNNQDIYIAFKYNGVGTSGRMWYIDNVHVYVGELFTKAINAYSGDGGYYLIASPVGTVNPGNVANMLSNNYDLYSFDQSEDLEWRNHKQDGGFDLISGKGYLYANDHDVTLRFTGTPYNNNGQVDLAYDASAVLKGWNLIGNPFGTDAALNMPFIRLADGGYSQVETEGQTVNCMEGVFVQATENGQSANFTPVRRGESTSIAKLNISVVASTSSSTALDNAIVRFDGGATLGKFQLNPSHTKVYIPQEGKDYAIVRSATQGELPLNFKAEKNGTYMLSFCTEEVTFSYLHLIDNMTGADVDLLAGASTLRQAQGSATYTFEAKTTDYASRFRLVYSANNTDENGASTGSATFAYYNGSNWTVSATGSGTATLQVIDMMGRVLSSKTISGNTEININQPAGVYMLRLIDNENVRVQKVVVR